MVCNMLNWVWFKHKNGDAFCRFVFRPNILSDTLNSQLALSGSLKNVVSRIVSPNKCYVCEAKPWTKKTQPCIVINVFGKHIHLFWLDVGILWHRWRIQGGCVGAPPPRNFFRSAKKGENLGPRHPRKKVSMARPPPFFSGSATVGTNIL